MNLTLLALLLHIMESKQYERTSSIEDVLSECLFENNDSAFDVDAVTEHTTEFSDSTIYTLLCLAGFEEEIKHYKGYRMPSLDGYMEAVVYYLLREALVGIKTLSELRAMELIDIKSRIDKAVNHALTLDLFNEI